MIGRILKTIRANNKNRKNFKPSSSWEIMAEKGGLGGAAMDGIRLAFAIGIMLAIVNGGWARFNKSGNTLAQSVDNTLNVGSKVGMGTSV